MLLKNNNMVSKWKISVQSNMLAACRHPAYSTVILLQGVELLHWLWCTLFQILIDMNTISHIQFLLFPSIQKWSYTCICVDDCSNPTYWSVVIMWM